MSNDQVVGLVRFSVLPKSPGAFAISRNKDLDAYRASLFSAERLEKRFSLFEAVTLPSLDGQVDKQFDIIVCTSTCLPEQYKERLDSIKSQRPYLSIRYFDSSKTMSRIAAECVSEVQKSERVLSFRLDDDDALSSDFVSQLRNISPSCNPGQVISLSSGVYIQKSQEGGLNIAELFYPKIAIGLCYIRGQNDESTIFNAGNHANINPDNLLIIETPDFCWIRSVYGESDSQHLRDVFKIHKKSRTHLNISCDEAAEMLQERFPLIDFKRMQQALR